MSNQKNCRNILIAEDNNDIREILEDVLKNEGYHVEVVKNGKEALKKLKMLRTPTLVLLDLMMPVMSGWEFLDAQKNEPQIASHPVIVMSAVPASQSLEDSTPLEIAGCLPKPISLNNLLNKVREFCGPAPVSEMSAASAAVA